LLDFGFLLPSFFHKNKKEKEIEKEKKNEITP